MARPRKPELEAARRAMVADAAMALLAKESWRSVTLSAVATKAGVSKGVVTYWYPSKDALILAAIRRHHAQYQEALAGITMTSGNIDTQLEALVEAVFPSREEVAREVAFQAEMWSYAKEHPEVREDIVSSYRWFRQACGALLAVAESQGLVKASDIEGLTRSIHALVDGLSIHVAFDPDTDIDEVRARLLAHLRDWFG